MFTIKKWQKFTKEELEQFVKESNSLKELAQKCGYSSDQGRIAIKKMLEEYGWEEPRQIDDLTNQVFGKLTVLYRVDKCSSNSKGYKLIYWHCKCECGNECDVYAGSLKAIGGTKSCGCILSKGEQKIQEILQNNKIIFETQKTFDTCKFPDTNHLAKFDFWINNYYIVEFDGSQHFEAKNTGWNTSENLIKTQEHDKIKNQWCKDNNIPIIRIPYWHLDNLCLNDLLLETSQFKIFP